MDLKLTQLLMAYMVLPSRIHVTFKFIKPSIHDGHVGRQPAAGKKNSQRTAIRNSWKQLEGVLAAVSQAMLKTILTTKQKHHTWMLMLSCEVLDRYKILS